MARKKHPGQRNSLDALCGRYDVDNSRRDKHGALLDAEILADVYLAMTGGQTALLLDADGGGQNDAQSVENTRPIKRAADARLIVIHANEQEIASHEARLDAIARLSGAEPVWRRSGE
jgi:DNA polymerase-3 subunit epsilon